MVFMVISSLVLLSKSAFRANKGFLVINAVRHFAGRWPLPSRANGRRTEASKVLYSQLAKRVPYEKSRKSSFEHRCSTKRKSIYLWQYSASATGDVADAGASGLRKSVGTIHWPFPRTQTRRNANQRQNAYKYLTRLRKHAVNANLPLVELWLVVSQR